MLCRLPAASPRSENVSPTYPPAPDAAAAGRPNSAVRPLKGNVYDAEYSISTSMDITQPAAAAAAMAAASAAFSGMSGIEVRWGFGA